VTHTLIYPHSSAHDDSGHLAIGGCDVVELATARLAADRRLWLREGQRLQCSTPPAVVMMGDGRARLIVERETWDDLLRLQRPLHE
jgi:hypothetical protein